MTWTPFSLKMFARTLHKNSHTSSCLLNTGIWIIQLTNNSWLESSSDRAVMINFSLWSCFSGSCSILLSLKSLPYIVKSHAPDDVSNCTERALLQRRTSKTGRLLGEEDDLWLAIEIVIFLFIHCEETTLQLGEDERSDEEFVYIRGLEESRTCELSPANLPCCVFVFV